MTTGLRILAMVNTYLPGFRSGGPVRSMSGVVNYLGDVDRFMILTRDRDSGEGEPYPSVTPDQWQRRGKAQVFYASPRSLSMFKLRKVIRGCDVDVLYLNSYFNFNFTIKPLLLRRFGLIPDIPAIVAPRGEFATGALQLKSRKKRLYLKLSRLFGIYRDVLWQASSEHEAADIRKYFGGGSAVVVARNLPDAAEESSQRLPRPEKRPGELKLVYLARIAAMKNLLFALHALRKVQGNVTFDVFGPCEDQRYWGECVKVMETLPANVAVSYRGPVPHGEVPRVLAPYHLLFLPTLGENYGHSILEALLAGKPPLISDRTPWRGLFEAGIGWDLPLEQPERFVATLQSCVHMDDREFEGWSQRAADYGNEHCRDPEAVVQNQRLFRHAAGRL